MIQDENLHGLPVAYSIMRTEEDSNMEFSYNNFTPFIDHDKNKVIFVDKDLQNIDILRKLFPKAKILLCTFHVIKYLHSKIANCLSSH